MVYRPLQVLARQTAGGVITGVDYHDGRGLVPLSQFVPDPATKALSGSVWVYGGSWSGGSKLKFEDGFGLEYFTDSQTDFIAPLTGNYNVSINGVQKATEGNFGKIFLVANANANSIFPVLIGQTLKKNISLRKGESLGIWVGPPHSTSGKLSSSLNFLISW